MAKITIAELNLDSSALLKSATENKKVIDDLKKGLNDLRDANGKVTEAYVQQEARIKTLSTEYNAQKNVLTSLTDVSGKLEKSAKAVTDLVNKENTSIAAARKNNTDLLKVRNELNLATAEGQDALKNINDKLNENNTFIKSNVSEYEKQKIGIGDYKNAIKDAFTEMGFFGGATKSLGVDMGTLTSIFGTITPLIDFFKEGLIGGVKEMTSFAGLSKESASASNENATATQNMSVAQKALAIATNVGTGAVRIFTLALAATGIGLIIAAIVLLIGYFKTFTPIVDKVEQAFAGVSAVVKVVQQALVSFIEGLSDLEGTLKKVTAFLSNPVQGFKDIGKAMGEAFDAAAKLKKAQQDLEDAMELQEIASAKNRAEINRLNIQAKDRTKTEQERLDLLAQAAKIEEADFQQRRKNADEQLRIAQQQIINEAKLTAAEVAELKKRGFEYKEYVETKTNNTDELFDALKEAQLSQIDLENEFYSNQEKNINKQNKLLEDQEAAREKAREKAEAAAKKAEEERQKALDYAVKLSKAELDLFLSEQGIKAKGLKETIELAEQVRDQRLAIAQKEFEATKKTEADKLALQTAQNNIKNEFLKTQSEALIANADREVEIELAKNQRILDNDKFLSEQLLEQKRQALQANLQVQTEYEAERLALGQITQQAYNDAINQINEENRLANEELEIQRKQAAIDQQLTDLENRRLGDQLTFDQDLAIRLQQLEIQKNQELANADKTGADRTLIQKKYGQIEKQMRAEVEASKLSVIEGALGSAKGLFKENTVAYKALAIAEASINTYKNAVAAYAAGLSIGGPAGLILAPISAGIAVAAGIANIAKIAGVKFEKGGIATKGGAITRIEGKSHAQGGEPVFIGNQYVGEAQGDEGVGILNRGAFKAFMNFNNSNKDGALSSPTFMAGGGIITQTVRPSGQIDTAALAAVVVEAVGALPSPIATIEDIRYKNDEVMTIESGANF